MVAPARPDRSLIRQKWEGGRNAQQITNHLRTWDLLSRSDRELLLVGISLESGDLPVIGQYGYAEFRPVDNDHRLITTTAAGEWLDEAADSQAAGAAAARNARSGAAALGAGTSPVRSAAQGAEAGPPARERLNLKQSQRAEVIGEDSRDLAMYFPQFSPIIFDSDLGLWFREGAIQPLSAQSTHFSVRFYYETEPLALPMVVANPVRAGSPHLWTQQRNGRVFSSLCYTFAPDGTVVRGRDDDFASEVLRQVVLWLIKHMVWCRFGFWAGADVGHDPAEIERSTKLEDPCPAHSWRRYGECCRARVLLELEKRKALRFGVHPSRRAS